MKNLFILLIAAFLLNVNGFAKSIEQKAAKQVAQNWLKKTALFTRHLPIVKYSVLNTPRPITAETPDQQIIAWVFTLKPQGYIIVSADDRIKPIIAYSDDAPFGAEHAPESILTKVIKNDIPRQLQFVSENPDKSELYSEEWRNLTSSLFTAKSAETEADIYGPHLTSVWGQGTVWNSVKYEYERVFNRFTPNYWAVGCVALAMAQDMHYYEWPLMGVNSHSYTEDDAGTLSVDYWKATYAWPDMLDDYGSQLTTNDQKNAAGELAYHCAVSVNMDFEESGSTSSTSDVPFALHTYFRYTGHYETPGGYGSFYSRMRTNMENSRVDIIALSDGSTYGHTVDVDGYDANNGYFHLNMGWLGSDNGWYNIQGSFNAGGYTSVTGAVLDIFPEPALKKIVSTEPDPKSFTVSWNVSENLNADYYQLQQKYGSEGSWSTISSSITNTFYKVSVSSDGTYYYRVRAHVDGAWWDDSYSVSRSVTTLSNGDYRTQSSGNWNSISTWQVYNNGWVNASSTPTSSDGKITIKSGHSVTVTAGVTADQVEVEENGSLVVADGVDLKINNGTSTDLRVYGTLRKEGSGRILYTGSGTTTSTFYDGSLFQLAGTNKYIIVADWNENSTVEISGNIGGDMTSTYHSDQEFGNFIWDCSGQTSDVYFSGSLTKINGNFTLKNTNGYEFRLTGTAGSDPTVTVYGDVTIEGGTLNLTSGDNNLYFVCRQNFTQSGGTLKASGAGTGYLRFGPNSGGGYSGTFNYSGGTFTPENIRINSVYELILNSNMNLGSTPLTVEGTINCGNYVVSGSGTFTLSSIGRIKIGHANGLNGNIQTSSKSFNAAGDYEYIGTTDQVTGTDLPASLTDGLIINAEGDVTLSQSTTLSGGNTGILLRNGRFNTSSDTLFTLANDGGWWGGSTESFVNGPIEKIRSSTNAFSFPTGKNNTYRRCRIIPASSSETHFRAEYFDEPWSDISSIGPGLDNVSNQEYWRIDRTSGSTDTQIGLYWDADCGIDDIDAVTTAHWDGSVWENSGRSEVEGTTSSGRVTSNVVSDLGVFTFGNVTASALDDQDALLPQTIKLNQNYPNPFNNSTLIQYTLPKSLKIKLELFNVLGEKIKTLYSGTQKSGEHKLSLDATQLSSGLYFYKLTSKNYVRVKKLILLK